MIRLYDDRVRDEAVEFTKTRGELLHIPALVNVVDVLNERVKEAVEKGDPDLVELGVYASATAAAMKCIPKEIVLSETRKYYLCPACLQMYPVDDCEPNPFCSHCGQAIAWPEEMGKEAPTPADLLAITLENKDD